MKRFLTILCGMLCIAFSLSGQEQSEEEYYHAGQSFVGGNVAIGKVSPYSGGLLGINYGRTLSKRFSAGVGVNVGFANPEEFIPFFSIAPFARYNVLMDGPVALYGQANLAVAMAFYDGENGGVIWPNLSAGISYRLSKHFTAFGQMGLVHLFAIPFGSMFSNGGSGSGSGSGYYPDDEWDGPGSSGSDFPILVGISNHPVIGIYYTF